MDGKCSGTEGKLCLEQFHIKSTISDSSIESAASQTFKHEVYFNQPYGLKYTGEWSGTQQEGEGIQTWPGGQTYVGQFVRGGVHGEGVYTQPDGFRYAGQWQNAKQHGHGSEYFQEKPRYVGQYEDGKFEGSGLYICVDGSVYEGQFMDDRCHGEGVYLWSGGENGCKYSGEWRDNVMHGRGVFSYPDGRKYDGEYVDNVKHGVGTFTWPDGREYAGQWSYGSPHGLGIYTAVQLSSRPGVWKHGEAQWMGDNCSCCMQFQKMVSSMLDAHKKAVPLIDGDKLKIMQRHHLAGTLALEGETTENGEPHACVDGVLGKRILALSQSQSPVVALPPVNELDDICQIRATPHCGPINCCLKSRRAFDI